MSEIDKNMPKVLTEKVMKEKISALEKENAEMKEDVGEYNSLLMAVETIHETETRFDTALRYIQETERESRTGETKQNPQR